MSLVSRISGASAVILSLGAAVFSCASAFVSQSEVTSLRVFGVQVDTPYGKPGKDVNLSMLYFDASKRAYDASGQPSPDHHVQILWLSGCNDPAGDSYYNCYPILAELFKNLPSGDISPANLPPELLKNVGLGDTFKTTIPDDIITRRAAPADGNTPYGVTFVFFAACGGKLGPPAPGQASGFPLGCYDETTGAALGPDDFVIGYTPIYTYDDFTNANPVITGGTYLGKPSMNVACTTDAMCGASEKCGQSGLCIPVIPHCTAAKVADCPTYALKPTVDMSSVELDSAAPADAGTVPMEVIWVAYYASDGVVGDELRLVNDSKMGWNDDYGTTISAPNAPAGEARVWAVVHDNRGGTSWWWQDVFVN